MKNIILISIISLSTIPSFCQIISGSLPDTITKDKKSKVELYNMGVSYLNRNMYSSADSLFTLAIKEGDRNKDTYYNRAIARKKSGNICGFCVDLVRAADLGDKDANTAFWKNCPKIDSIFTCEKKMTVSISDTIVSITHFDSSSHTKRMSIIQKNNGLALRYFIDSAGKIDSYNLDDRSFNLEGIEEPAQFPGGDVELFRFIQKNMRYPQAEMDKGIEGRVLITYVIDKDGSITDISVHRGLNNGPGCNAEALRIVNSMPKWKPAKQNKKPVRMRFILPFVFKIK